MENIKNKMIVFYIFDIFDISIFSRK